MDSYDGAEDAPSSVNSPDPEPKAQAAPATSGSASLGHSIESTSSGGGYTPNFSALKGKRAGFKSPVVRR